MAKDAAQKLQEQVVMFGNRLSKRAQYLKKWAKRQKIGAFRVYDRDIPEIPLSVDLYELDNHGATQHYAVLSLFERPYDKDPQEEDNWLDAMQIATERVLSLEPHHALVKRRRRQRGTQQYEKMQGAHAICGIVSEGDLKFHVNLSDYLDTGLFLDHRPLREKLRQTSEGRRVLNLFGYTGALSVAAAKGGADFIQTVDLSNTYLGWARKNLELNGFSNEGRYPCVRGDVRDFLYTEIRKRRANNIPGYDFILLDPPTFSNSSMATQILDTNRDWPELVDLCVALLKRDGMLYFSTNSRRLSFDATRLQTHVECKDITSQTIPEDFKNHRIHQCWIIRKA